MFLNKFISVNGSLALLHYGKLNSSAALLKNTIQREQMLLIASPFLVFLSETRN